jgi:hypothetical protein
VEVCGQPGECGDDRADGEDDTKGGIGGENVVEELG